MGVSITQVAAKAEVSRMTVSRVLRNEPAVRAATRQRVLEAMTALGYVPSTAARAMRRKDRLFENGSPCCALVFGADTANADSFFNEVARAAEKEAAQQGWSLLQSHWQQSFSASWPRLQTALAVSGLCGVVLAGQFAAEEVKTILAHTQHVVVVDGPAPPEIAVGSVESDNLGGACLALNHLRQRGVKRLLLLTGTQGHYFSQAMHQAIEQVGPWETVETVHTDLTAANGYQVTRERFTGSATYDGVFANDELALGVLRALAELKKAVPRDVKVVGFDNIAHAPFTWPALTSVQIEKARLGSEAVRTLASMVRGDSDALAIRKVVQASLIVRESS